ncbi:MAG: ribonuclease H-like domain-containing protein, partial [Anaerolineales bacterium]|nr:ribonuclease H-like domain-containing protein [Anaerolineales bacterium]
RNLKAPETPVQIPGRDRLSQPVDRPPLLPDDGPPPPIEKLLPGSAEVSNERGSCLVWDRVYPLAHLHGGLPLQALLGWQPAGHAHLFHPEDAAIDFDYRQALFIDTETTGLWGVGTIAFMVGVGFFEGDAFVVRQYFLRDHGEEAAMLQMLHELAASRAALVSFNGRTFDLPLLDNRFIMNRMFSDLFDLPHLDLLLPARRVWRRRLGSVALGALERNLLGIQRTQEDVPGMLIPQMYHDFLRHGDGRELVRVFYHNEQDILSMVTVAANLAQLLAEPAAVAEPDDLLSLARWHIRRQEYDEAETMLRQALAGEMPLALYQELVQELAYLLKRTGRSDEAVKYWQQIAVTSLDSVLGHLELAKYYEWQRRDWGEAIYWTEQALEIVGQMRPQPPTPENWRQIELLEDELRHRHARLERKSFHT